MQRQMQILIVAIACIGGCAEQESVVTKPEDVRRYASLPGLTQSHDRELRAELARLIAERATPELLSDDADMPSDSVVELNAILPPRSHASMRKRLRAIWPRQRFEFSHATLQVASELNQRYEDRRQRFRQLLERPDFCPRVDHTVGMAFDSSFIDAMEVGQLLIGLEAAESLRYDSLDAAIESLGLMLRASQELAGQKDPLTRCAAVHRRAEALQVLQAIAQHPSASTSTHRQLADALAQTLEDWPSDDQAWVGDRARGLHTYELVRDGYLLSLLSYDEIRAHRDEIGIPKLAKIVAQNIDRDELFYLNSMRQVIDACERPLRERRAVIDKISDELEVLRGSDVYPFVADQILMVRLWEGHRLQVLDRARCEAWSLALQLALGCDAEVQTLNPLTGQRYDVRLDGEQVRVDEIDLELRHPAIIVPIRGKS